jgi:hypothetical protein
LLSLRTGNFDESPALQIAASAKERGEELGAMGHPHFIFNVEWLPGTGR